MDLIENIDKIEDKSVIKLIEETKINSINEVITTSSGEINKKKEELM